MTFQQVQKYEKGVSRINAGRLQRISEALEVPITFFFDGQTSLPTRSEKSGVRSRASVRDVEIGRRVRSRRLECGLSQTGLADRIGVTFQQVQKYEKGVIRINAGHLQRISEALEVPISDFFPDSAFLATRDQDGSAENIFDLSKSGPAQIVRAYRRIESPRARQLLLQIANDFAEEFEAAGGIDEPEIATRLLRIAETAIKSA